MFERFAADDPRLPVRSSRELAAVRAETARPFSTTNFWS